MTQKQAFKEVAEVLGLGVVDVINIYKAYWKAIFEIMESLDIDNIPINEESFKKYSSTFNIRLLGKFYIPFKRFKMIRYGGTKYQKYKANV